MINYNSVEHFSLLLLSYERIGWLRAMVFSISPVLFYIFADSGDEGNNEEEGVKG